MATRSKTEIYVKDYPGQLKSLRQTAGETEPALGFGLWVLLAKQGIRHAFIAASWMDLSPAWAKSHPARRPVGPQR